MRNLVALLFAAGALWAAPPKLNPAQWSLTASPLAGTSGKVLLKLRAEIEPGFHIYSLTTPKGGPIRTTVRVGETAAAEVYQPKPEVRKEPAFDLTVETFEGHVDLLMPVQAAAGRYAVTVRYQSCNGEICLPPTERTAEVQVVEGRPGVIPAGYRKVTAVR